MIVDAVVVLVLMLILKKKLKCKDNGKIFLQAILIYTIVGMLLRITGSRGYDLVTMIKSRESYHDAEIKKLFQ